jgi:hypothetical protein
MSQTHHPPKLRLGVRCCAPMRAGVSPLITSHTPRTAGGGDGWRTFGSVAFMPLSAAKNFGVDAVVFLSHTFGAVQGSASCCRGCQYPRAHPQ